MAGWFKTGTVSPGPAAYYIRRDFDSPGTCAGGEYGLASNSLAFSGSAAVTSSKRSHSPINRAEAGRLPSAYRRLSPMGSLRDTRSSPLLQRETYRSPSPPPKELTPSHKVRCSPQIQITYDVTPRQQTCSKRATSPLYHAGSYTIPHTRPSSPIQTSRFISNIHTRVEIRSQKTPAPLATSPTRSSKPCTGPAFSIKGREIMWQETWRAMLANSI